MSGTVNRPFLAFYPRFCSFPHPIYGRLFLLLRLCLRRRCCLVRSICSRVLSKHMHFECKLTNCPLFVYDHMYCIIVDWVLVLLRSNFGVYFCLFYYVLADILIPMLVVPSSNWLPCKSVFHLWWTTTFSIWMQWKTKSSEIGAW